MLNENEFWQRVRGLEGETVYTLERQNPNRILRVTDEDIEIENRGTRPIRDDVLQVYRELHRRGEITGDDLYGENSVVGHELAHKSGRIMMAILARAVPEEISIIRRSKTERLSGIRLRSNLVS